jgi:hypothetical protein
MIIPSHSPYVPVSIHDGTRMVKFIPGMSGSKLDFGRIDEIDPIRIKRKDLSTGGEFSSFHAPLAVFYGVVYSLQCGPDRRFFEPLLKKWF